MPFTVLSANAYLKLTLQGIAIPGLAQNPVSGALTQLWLGLYTSSPGSGATQLTNELTAPGYGRVAVNRDGNTWNIVGELANLINPVDFPTISSGSGICTHVGLGTSQNGDGLLLVHGALDPNVPYEAGLQPRLASNLFVRFVAAT